MNSRRFGLSFGTNKRFSLKITDLRVAFSPCSAVADLSNRVLLLVVDCYAFLGEHKHNATAANHLVLFVLLYFFFSFDEVLLDRGVIKLTTNTCSLKLL
jgi:hypothetical protein